MFGLLAILTYLLLMCLGRLGLLHLRLICIDAYLSSKVADSPPPRCGLERVYLLAQCRVVRRACEFLQSRRLWWGSTILVDSFVWWKRRGAAAGSPSRHSLGSRWMTGFLCP
ncbi:hypothetical protein B0H10DRAFT_2019779, partial [Mycena sp. CBHHK59/15]